MHPLSPTSPGGISPVSLVAFFLGGGVVRTMKLKISELRILNEDFPNSYDGFLIHPHDPEKA